MKKILIIGAGGAGKSTLAQRLGAAIGIEVVHLDRLYWRAGWQEPSKEEWQKILENELKKDEWIMDGNFGGTLDLRLKYCDTVIFLEMPRAVCVYRAVKRWIKYRNTNRPDMSEGCNEKVDLEFLGWICSFPKKKKPKIEQTLKRFENEKTIIRPRSRKDVEDFLLKCSQNSVLK